MAELLRDSVSKDENAGMGRMAAAPNPCKHLEAMEEAPNEGGQFKEAWNSSGQGIPVGEFPIGLLANRGKPSFRMFHYKRKTRSRIF